MSAGIDFLAKRVSNPVKSRVTMTIKITFQPYIYMTLISFATVTSNCVTSGHLESFDISLWVHVLIIWPKRRAPCNIASAFIVEAG